MFEIGGFVFGFGGGILLLHFVGDAEAEVGFEVLGIGGNGLLEFGGGLVPVFVAHVVDTVLRIFVTGGDDGRFDFFALVVDLNAGDVVGIGGAVDHIFDLRAACGGEDKKKGGGNDFGTHVHGVSLGWG